MKRTINLTIITIVLAAIASAENVNDFDIACKIFTEAKNTTFIDDEMRNAYVENNIDARIHSKTVKDTYYVVFNLPPEQRYDLVKKAAEHELKRSWGCPAAVVLLK